LPEAISPTITGK